jgi:tetratricopeptide (TPR) repeat protein
VTSGDARASEPGLDGSTSGGPVAVSAAPDDPARAAYRRGIELLARGTPREAASSFRSALAKGYQPPADAYYQLGLAYKQVPLRKFRAIRAFKDALRRDPGAIEPLYEFADTYLLLDGWEGQREARHALVSILERDPLYRDAFQRWEALWPNADEQRKVVRALRGRLASSFEPRVAALAAALHLQLGETEELAGLLEHWKLEGAASSAYHYWRARWLFMKAEDDDATRAFLAALGAVQSRDDLEPFWQDLESLIDPGDRELAETRSLGGQVAFLRGFWTARDPLPFTVANERLAEQYRRVSQVRRRYLWKKPLAKEKTIGHYVDDLGRPSFDTRLEGRSVDDRGTIYLRHGEPDVRFVEVGGGEYWRYDRPGLAEGHLQFHFKLMEGPMGRGNDTVYSILPTTDMGVANVRQGHAGQEGVENTLLGLGTDTYDFDYGKKVFPVAVAGATFRSLESPARTDLLLALGVPLVSIRGFEGDRAARLVQQLKLYDEDYREELALSDTLRLDGTEGDRGSLVGAFQISDYPGSRRYAVQVQAVGSGALGLQRGDLVLPSYAERGLQLSDVLFASHVAPAADDQVGLRREGFAIRPLLGSGLSRAQPLHLYYEIYDLPAAADGRAHYRVEYRVSAEEGARPGLLARVFGADARPSSDENGVALAFEKERPAAAERTGETISLDLSELPPGRYRVMVTVRDLSSAREASRVVVLDLRDSGAGEGGLDARAIPAGQ